MNGSFPHAKSYSVLRVFQHKTEGFIQRHLVRNASQNAVKNPTLDMRKLYIKKPHNIKTQLGNYAEVTNEIVMGKKIMNNQKPTES